MSNQQPSQLNKPVLVLGANGKTGSRVVARLDDIGAQVRSGSRAGKPPFDWQNPNTWAATLHGVGSVYVTFQPDLAVPGADEAIRDFAGLAATLGVEHLVLLSGRGEPEARECERIVRESGVDWTIVRASWFNQNFSESYLLDPILAGEVALPVDHVGEPFLDADDIADTVVAALTDNRHKGELYELTGPRLLTFGEAVEEISAATGRDIRFRSIELEDYTAMLAEHGAPANVTSLLEYLFGTVLDGRNSHVTDGVRRALNRHPRDFSDYARITAAAGTWTP